MKLVDGIFYLADRDLLTLADERVVNIVAEFDFFGERTVASEGGLLVGT